MDLLKVNITNILLWSTALFFLIQVMYFFLIYFRMSFEGKKEKERNELKPVSVIICARNEEKNLLKFIPQIVEQDYPNLQVVIINDRSWDESWDVMEALARKFDKIKLVNIPDNGKDGYAKKYALTIGIKAAKHDQLVFIDADCYPQSNQWLKKMAEKFSVEKRIVLGAGGFNRKPGMLNKLQRFDTCNIALNYLAYAKAGVPYMGVGRNLGYKNELYDSVRGFKSHYHIESGDDDLFVNQTATSKNVGVCFHEEAITWSEAKPNFKSWRAQKKRHLTTGSHYRFIHKLLLGLFPMSFIFFLILAIMTACLHDAWYIPLGMILLRMILQWITSWRVFKIMKSKDVLIWIPVFEIIMLILNPYWMLTYKPNNKYH